MGSRYAVKSSKKCAGFFAGLCCIFLCLSTLFVYGSLTVGAAQKYTVKELDEMTIELPDDFIAIGRDAAETDRYFSFFGQSYSQTMSSFESSDIYLQGMDENRTRTVTVTMTQTDESKGINNYNLLGQEELNKIADNFLSQQEFVSCTPEAPKELIWFCFEITASNGGQSVKAYQANTVYDGMIVNITIQRNGANADYSDYQTLEGIISSVKFLKTNIFSGILPYIIIGTVVVLILFIVVLVLIVRHIKREKKRSRNNKIIEELADKYVTKKADPSEVDYSEYNFVDEEQYSREQRKNADLNAAAEPPVGGETKIYHINKALETTASAPDEIVSDIETETPVLSEDAEAGLINDADDSDLIDGDNSLEESEQDSAEEAEDSNELISHISDKLFGESVDDDNEDFINDEELVRSQVSHISFDDSDDFFDEAPTKTIGVISSKDIIEAEDFDVINEVEEKASAVETPAEKEKISALDILKKVGGSIKSFGVHCGYFCTNVSRAIKRKRAKKKRMKAEQERRERARRRAERERQMRKEMENGGLVRVHSRDDRRPASNRSTSAQRRRPTNGSSNSRNNKRR